MRIDSCPFCQGDLKVAKLECRKCGTGFEGEFYTSPISALTEEQQSFIEFFVLSSGSLKEMAEITGVTYPTVRSRLDQIIADLKAQMKSREGYTRDILEKVAHGKISAEKAAQIIKNL